MGKLNIFKIELSQPRGVFYGGQWLQGYVCVELNAPMKMRGTGNWSPIILTVAMAPENKSSHIELWASQNYDR